MKRTISAMVGKGSVRHNSRQFHAENTDPDRSHLNIEYCNENIRDVYKELFEEARLRYNAKQKRADRCIDDYYEKIRSGRQEKPFHEFIIQIGNKDDCSSVTDDGKLAAEILDEYMKGFRERNPNLRVFSAHLHMDEATPHLHIDFVPYITGSSRGLDTRVSLKKALAAMGFKGGTRKETEWSQWADSEKKQLAEVMERHGMEWEHLGTHEEHLSVLDYKKRERLKEVSTLEEQKASLTEQNAAYEAINAELQAKAAEETAKAETAEKRALKAGKKLDAMTAGIDQVEKFSMKYIRPPDEWLPVPNRLETAKSYRGRAADSIEDNISPLISKMYAAFVKLQQKNEQLADRNQDLAGRVKRLDTLLDESRTENSSLRSSEADLDRARSILGGDIVNGAIRTARDQEQLRDDERRERKKLYNRNVK